MNPIIDLERLHEMVLKKKNTQCSSVITPRDNRLTPIITHFIILCTQLQLVKDNVLSYLIMRKHYILKFFLATNSKLRMKEDKAYMRNLKNKLFRIILHPTLCAMWIYEVPWHILCVLRTNKYIILWLVNFQMRHCQL